MKLTTGVLDGGAEEVEEERGRTPRLPLWAGGKSICLTKLSFAQFLLKLNIQAALVICGLLICDFTYM